MTVLNRPGAAQTIAINYLASKKGDANTIGLASGSFINAIARSGSTLHKNVTPLMKLFDAYQAYFTGIDSPIKSMAEVRDRLNANSSSLTFAFPVGLGSPLHVSVVNVAKASGATPGELVTVVYNSGSDVAAQAAGGHIEVGLTSIGSRDAAHRSGQAPHAGNCLARAHRRRTVASIRRYASKVSMWSPPTPIPCSCQTGSRPSRSNSGLAHSTRSLDPEFKLDLERNFWVLKPIRYPETVKWLQDDYDENRAILKELGMLQ